jgi:transglutaminase-like putative cysteine protease
VVEFEVTRPHRELVIDARAHVTTQPQPEPAESGWAELTVPGYREAGAEFLTQTDDAHGHALLDALQEEVGASATPLEALMLVSELIPERFEYRKGATYVDSPLTHVLDIRAGVCQDFVHLGLNLLRGRGIAARYVSGYLYTSGERSGEEEGSEASGAASVEVDTHAWIEALLPAADGGEPQWVSVDPTNRGLTGERHVKIGHGRHYADVPPIKGVYRGTAGSTLEASVTMTRG